MPIRFYQNLTYIQLVHLQRKWEQQHKATVLFMNVGADNADDVNVQHYRWSDDGTESGSTFLAAEDTSHDLDLSSGDVTSHLRVTFDGDTDITWQSDNQWRVYYDLNGGGATLITSSTSNVKAAGSGSGLTDAGNTTNRLTGIGGKSFVTMPWQEETDGTSGLGSVNVEVGEFTEAVIALTFIDADLGDNDSFVFTFEQVNDSGGWVAVQNIVAPTITIDKGVGGTRAPGRLSLLGVGHGADR